MSSVPAETPETYRLLRQIRAAMARIAGGTENREHQALLGSADLVLNELMLRTRSDFYVACIEQGRALLSEARRLLNAGTDDAAVIDPASNPDVLMGEINRLSSELASAFGAIDDTPGSPGRDLAERVCDWEARLYAHSREDAGSIPPSEADPFTREALETYLQKTFPEWTNLKITSFVALTGGFSKRTVLFETQDDVHGARELILRAEQTISLPRFSDITQEFHLIKFAVEAGLPTPDALWLEDDLSHFGKAFAIMEKAEGENYGWTMGQKVQLTERLVQSIIDALCAMHNAPVLSGNPRIAQSHLAEWQGCRTVSEATRHYVTDYMARLIRQTGIVPSPELARAIAWLQSNIPDVSDPPVLVHHDFGLNNILIEAEQVSAILDWEAAIVVDPAYDILVMQRELADYLSVAEFLERYKAGTGRTITPYNMAYAKVAAFAIYMIVYLNGRQSLIHNEKTPIAMSLLAFNYIANTAAQLNGLIAEAESLRE